MGRHATTRVLLCIGAAILIGAGSAQAKFKVLHSFQDGSDGAYPAANLLLIHERFTYRTYLYGTTSGGGAHGYGTVFRLTTYGSESVLYTFQGNFAGGSDGAYPYSSLITDKQGNFYGTTSQGGGAPDCSGLCGTVFKLAPDGVETTLYAFNFRHDGALPSADLLADGSGNFYSTTAKSHSTGHFGTIFKLAADGKETILHAFSGRKNGDGSHPYAALIADENGNFYGTTNNGGTTDCNCGTVFKLAADGTETVLHPFVGKETGDGAFPYAGVVADASGNLYGATWAGGGDCDCGTIFRIAPDGTETVLHAFAGGTEGAYPMGGLVLDKKGNLYGTTFLGGAGDVGTVFKLTP